MTGLHDNPAIYPTLPSRALDESGQRILDTAVGTVWRTCWEYVLTHNLTDAEGSAFWHGANLAMQAARAEVRS